MAVVVWDGETVQEEGLKKYGEAITEGKEEVVLEEGVEQEEAAERGRQGVGG
jgi:hypothetical protein